MEKGDDNVVACPSSVLVLELSRQLCGSLFFQLMFSLKLQLLEPAVQSGSQLGATFPALSYSPALKLSSPDLE